MHDTLRREGEFIGVMHDAFSSTPDEHVGGILLFDAIAPLLVIPDLRIKCTGSDPQFYGYSASGSVLPAEPAHKAQRSTTVFIMAVWDLSVSLSAPSR